ncbi:hypothetical protein D3C77_762910 [compost metagenome]
MVEDVHLKAPFGPAGDGFPDAAHADDPQLLMMDIQTEQFLVVAALPFAFLYVAVKLWYPAGSG